MEKQYGGSRKSPLQMNVADFVAPGSESFPAGALLALDQTSVGGKVLNALESVDIVYFVKNGHGEYLTNSGNRT